jgi:hypothetical protein
MPAPASRQVPMQHMARQFSVHMASVELNTPDGPKGLTLRVSPFTLRMTTSIE